MVGGGEWICVCLSVFVCLHACHSTPPCQTEIWILLSTQLALIPSSPKDSGVSQNQHREEMRQKNTQTHKENLANSPTVEMNDLSEALNTFSTV